MEEKDISFNILVSNENGVNINISSDIDDCLDYLNEDERLCIISKLVEQSTRLIIDRHYADESIEEYDETDETVNEVNADIEELLTQTVYVVINTIINTHRSKYGQSPSLTEYSLAMYNSGDFNPADTVETIHSNNVIAPDTLNAATAFILDTMMCLDDGGLPRADIIGLIQNMFNDILNEVKKAYNVE